MVRLSRLADYGVLLLTHLAQQPERLFNTTDLSLDTRLAVPTISKILQVLNREGLVASHRGMRGGYGLARPPERITVAEMVNALEGGVAMTDCVKGAPGECELEDVCRVRTNWQAINTAILDALQRVTLAEMAQVPQDLPPAHLVQLTRKNKEYNPFSGTTASSGNTHGMEGTF